MSYVYTALISLIVGVLGGVTVTILVARKNMNWLLTKYAEIQIKNRKLATNVDQMKTAIQNVVAGLR